MQRGGITCDSNFIPDMWIQIKRKAVGIISKKPVPTLCEYFVLGTLHTWQQ